MFDKKWRLVCRMKVEGEEDFLRYWQQDYRFYWFARFDAWYQRIAVRGTGAAVMTQIDNLPR